MIQIAILCILVATSSQFGIQIQGTSSKCYYFDAEAQQTIKIRWIVAGTKKNLDIQFADQQFPDQIIQQWTTKEDVRIIQIQKTSNYNLCFSNKDSENKVVELDIDVIRQDIPNRNDLIEMDISTRKLRDYIYQIRLNGQNQQVRNNNNRKTTQDSQKRVGQYSIIKFSIITITAGTQLYLLTKAFAKRKFAY